MFRNTILPTFRRVFVPSFGTVMLLIAWGGWWCGLIITASVLMAVDNPTRREPEATAYGQVELSYLDALYFLEVAVSSCGLGDIVPVTDGGRAIVFLASFIGTGIWGIIIGGLVIKVTNWIYNGIMNASYQDVKKRKKAKKAAKDMRGRNLTESGGNVEATTPRTPRSGSRSGSGDLELGDLTSSGGIKPKIDEEEDENDMEERPLDPLEGRVLPWYQLPLLNLIALFYWFGTHLIFAAVLHDLEPNLGNLTNGDLTPDNYGNVFYFTLVASQTICFGTDYNPKTEEGRAFWLFWHQICMTANTLLFVTVTLALLKWLDVKAFWLVGRVITKVKKQTVSDSDSDSDSDSEKESESSSGSDE